MIAPYTQPFKRIRKLYRVCRLPVLGDFVYGVAVEPMSWFKKPETFTLRGFDQDPQDAVYSKAEVTQAFRRKAFRNAAKDIFSLRRALDEFQGRYASIQMPVLILAGEKDVVAPPAEHAEPLIQKLPQAKLQVISQTGHLLMFAHSAEVLQAIEQATA